MDSTEAHRRLNIEAYFDAVKKEGLHSDSARLRSQMEFLYGDVDFRGKAVLDIGGGNGIHSFYAASCGAREVVCLEPEDSGSSKGVSDQFRRLGMALGCRNVRIEPIPLQAFPYGTGRFKIIILHDSINHLDEDACIALRGDARSQSAYRVLFAKIFALSAEGASVIICDCSRYNFFPLLGARNPFDPGIEWHKHQAPQTWIALLLEAGFANSQIAWSSPNRLGRWGRALLGNKCMAYFFTSHFRLAMEKQSS